MRKIVNLNKEIVKQEVKCWHCEKSHWQFPEMKYEKCPDCGNELHDSDVRDYLTSMSIQIDSDTGEVIAYSLDQQFESFYPGGLYKPNIDKLNTLNEKELILNQTDTKNILKTINISKDIKFPNIKFPNIGDLKIKLETHLNVSEEDKLAIKNFIEALDKLPKQLNLSIGINGNFDNKNNDLKINLESYIADMVKEHFKQ